MKRMLTSILMAVGIAGPLVSHLGAAGYGMSADIPFAFVAGQSTLPAGRYDVTKVNASGSVFQLRKASGDSVMVQFGIFEDRKSEKGTLTFACGGGECLLAKIATPGTEAARTIGKSAVEKHLHHTMGVASMISVKLSAR